MDQLSDDLIANYKKPLVSFSSAELKNSKAIIKLMEPKTEGQVIKFLGGFPYFSDFLTPVDRKLTKYFQNIPHLKNQFGSLDKEFLEKVTSAFIGKDIQSIFLGTGKFANLASEVGLINSVGVLSKKVIPKVVGAATGTVASGVTLLATTNNSIYCEERNYQYVNADEECKKYYQINKKVIDFLQLPVNQQLELMKDPRVCDYYRNLHKSEFSLPEEVKLIKKLDNSCSAIFSGKSNKLTVDVNMKSRSGDGEISLRKNAIPWIVLSVNKNKINNYDRLNSKAIMGDLVSREILDGIYQVQPYLPELISCCSESGCNQLITDKIHKNEYTDSSGKSNNSSNQ